MVEHYFIDRVDGTLWILHDLQDIVGMIPSKIIVVTKAVSLSSCNFWKNKLFLLRSYF